MAMDSCQIALGLGESKWILALGCKFLTPIVPTVLSGASVFLGGGLKLGLEFETIT